MDHVQDSLWITNIRGVQQNATSQFDVIITVCQDSVEANVNPDTYYHFPLADGEPPADAYNPGEFTYELFETVVDTIREHVAAGDETLVHCHAGQSRSAMTIAAALAVMHDIPFTDAVDRVSSQRTGGISPSREIQQFAEQYVTAYQESQNA